MFSRGLVIFPLFLTLLASSPLICEGQNTTLRTSLMLSGRYDDNVNFTRTAEIDDFSTIIEPIIGLDYLTELTRLNATADVRFVNYIEENDLDDTKQTYQLDGETRISERFFLNAGLGYIEDTLLESELEETGRVFNREGRQRFDAKGGMRFEASEISSVGADYRFIDVDYEEEDRTDRKVNNIFGYYSRSFKDGLHIVRISPGYSFRDSDGIEADSYSLSVGWTYKPSEVGVIHLSVGARYTEEFRPDQEKIDNYGVISDLSYTRKAEISQFKIGYNRNIRYDANDELIEVDRIYGNWQYGLSERLQFNIVGSLYFTRSEREDDREDSMFYDISPWLDYNLTERHVLRLRYRYSYEDDEERTIETASRSQYYLTVVFKWPYKF